MRPSPMIHHQGSPTWNLTTSPASRAIAAKARPTACKYPIAPEWAGDSNAEGGSQPVSAGRSEEHTSELQSLMRISYAVFCLKKKKPPLQTTDNILTNIAKRITLRITPTSTSQSNSQLS